MVQRQNFSAPINAIGSHRCKGTNRDQETVASPYESIVASPVEYLEYRIAAIEILEVGFADLSIDELSDIKFLFANGGPERVVFPETRSLGSGPSSEDFLIYGGIAERFVRLSEASPKSEERRYSQVFESIEDASPSRRKGTWATRVSARSSPDC